MSTTEVKSWSRWYADLTGRSCDRPLNHRRTITQHQPMILILFILAVPTSNPSPSWEPLPAMVWSA